MFLKTESGENAWGLLDFIMSDEEAELGVDLEQDLLVMLLIQEL